jgi:hypothetical protein
MWETFKLRNKNILQLDCSNGLVTDQKTGDGRKFKLIYACSIQDDKESWPPSSYYLKGAENTQVPIHRKRKPEKYELLLCFPKAQGQKHLSLKTEV